jgi:hypothetical protein
LETLDAALGRAANLAESGAGVRPLAGAAIILVAAAVTGPGLSASAGDAMNHRQLIVCAATVLSVVACTNAHEAGGADLPVAVEQRPPTIEHVAPRRDFVGAPPTQFEWTAAANADAYALGVWDDVDRLIWRADHVKETTVSVPKDIEFVFGTYYWSVTALRGDQPVGESGRSAFVVDR